MQSALHAKGDKTIIPPRNRFYGTIFGARCQSHLSVSQLAPKCWILANAMKIGCPDRSRALSSTHESASWFTCGLCGLFYFRALGSCSGGLFFWRRLLCALILSVVRRLLRLSWLRVLQLLPELLRLWLGRLLPALVEA